MTLTNIEYGSLASSETLNNNFSYLDDRISSTAETIMTSISSILSNIATINSRLTEISEDAADSVSALDTKVEEYRTKTKLLVSMSSIVPNWSGLSSIDLTSSNYTVTSNGYILVMPSTGTSGNITVNNVTIEVKSVVSAYDNAALLISVPVKSGDVVSCTAELKYAYFLPAAEINVSNF